MHDWRQHLQALQAVGRFPRRIPLHLSRFVTRKCYVAPFDFRLCPRAVSVRIKIVAKGHIQDPSRIWIVVRLRGSRLHEWRRVLPGYFSIWPFVAEIGILFVIAATSPFAAADSPPIPERSRLENLDGLRGFLALSVFFHHAAVYHQYLQTGRWGFPPSRFYTLLGSVGVSMFFMVTGHLFYSQVLKANGKLNWKKLYVGRVFRILPLYWFTIALLFIGVGIHTSWQLRVPLHQLLLQLAQWLAGGVFEGPWINGYSNTTRLTVSATWTLQYEWFFYLSLLVVAIPARWRRLGLLIPPVLLAGILLYQAFLVDPSKPWVRVGLFLAGMSSAALKMARPQLKVQSHLASFAVVAFFCLTFVYCPRVYLPLSVVLLGAAFLLITLGASLFGLLTSYPARRLGNISYGIYLLQGPVFAVFVAARPIRTLDLYSPLGHFLVSIMEGFALVVLATLAHRFIERPAIDLGRRVVSPKATKGQIEAVTAG